MKKILTLLSLSASFLGTVFLWFSFQAAPVSFDIVNDKEGHEFICSGAIAVFETGGINKRGATIGALCPEGQPRRPLAAVFINHPFLMPTGWILLAAGFLLQGILTFSEVDSSPLSSSERNLLRRVLKEKKLT